MKLSVQAAAAGTLAGALFCTSSTLAVVDLIPFNAWNGVSSEGANNMTPDGSIVLGAWKPWGAGRWQTYRWSATGSFEWLTADIPAGGVARAMSSDASVIVGTLNGDIGYNAARPFYWREGVGLVTPGVLPGGTYGWATGVSGDGSMMVGYGDSGGYVRWKWTMASGYQTLTAPAGYSGAWVCSNGISEDGSVIAGYVRSDTSNTLYPARWTSTGVQVCPVAGSSNGLRRDGRAVLFASVNAMRWWDDGRIDDLGTLPGANVCWPVASSDDGGVVVGSANVAPYTGRAWIWTDAAGMMYLDMFLQSNGVNTSAWAFSAITSISADGTTLCGFGTHTYSPGNSRQESFLVTIPGPLGGFVLAMPVMLCAARRRAV